MTMNSQICQAIRWGAICCAFGAVAIALSEARSWPDDSLIVQCADRIVTIAGPEEGRIWIIANGQRVFPQRVARTHCEFEFRGLPSGSAELFVEDPSFLPVRRAIEFRGESQRETVQLTGVHSVSFRPQESTTGVRIPVRHVTVRAVAGRWLGPLSGGRGEYVKTKFSIRDWTADASLRLPPGDYVFELESDGFARCFASVPLDSEESKERELAIQFSLPGCIVGQMEIDQSPPRARALLFEAGHELLPAVGFFANGKPGTGDALGYGREIAECALDGASSFCLTSVGPGVYRVKVVAAGSNRTWLSKDIVVAAGKVAIAQFPE